MEPISVTSKYEFDEHGDFNTQLEQQHVGGLFSIPDDRADRGDRLIQLSSEHRLLLAKKLLS